MRKIKIITKKSTFRPARGVPMSWGSHWWYRSCRFPTSIYEGSKDIV